MSFAKTICIVAMIAAFAILTTIAQSNLSWSQYEEITHARFNEIKRERLSPSEDIPCSTGAGAVVDYNLPLSIETMRCFANNGFTTSIPRGYRSLGRVDDNLETNVQNSRAAGFKYIDTYMFPCPTCSKSATTQFNELWSYLKTNKVNIGMIWLDLEGASLWTGSITNNIAFATDLFNAAKASGAVIGVYSSSVQWRDLFGDWTSPVHPPLWYSRYQTDTSCAGFIQFGGWTKADLHQFAGDTTVCNSIIDISSYC